MFEYWLDRNKWKKNQILSPWQVRLKKDPNVGIEVMDLS